MASVELYKVANSEKIKHLEEELAKALTDLQNDVEENETLGGASRVASSVALPKSIEHFRKQREQIIKRSIQVSEAKPIIVQSEVMKEEVEACVKREYTTESLPLLLHQYFCDRIRQLVQCKHMHMLRWKRFCEHTSTLEALYPIYQKRLEQIMSEYNDSLARARRLAVAHETYLMGKPPAHNAITEEDLMIYTRWLTCYVHSVKKIHGFLRLLEWLPIKWEHDIVPPSRAEQNEEADEEEFSRSPRSTTRPSSMMSDHKTQGIQSNGRWSVFEGRQSITDTTAPSVGRISRLSVLSSTIHERPESGSSDGRCSSRRSSSVNWPGTGTVPHTAQAIAAAAAAGGGPASDSESLGIPCHVIDFEGIRPMLEFLMTCYGVSLDLDKIGGPSDEMELVAQVNKKFKSLFLKQHEQNTFPTYDKLEMGNESWGADASFHALRKESNWLPFIKLKAEKDPKQEKMLTKLRQQSSIDELLRAQSKFLTVTDAEKVQDALRDHAIAVRDPPTVHPTSVTSHKTAAKTNAIWKKIYCSNQLYENSQHDDELNVTEFDEKDADNVSFGGRNSRASTTSSVRRRKGGGDGDQYNYMSVMTLLGLDDDASQHDPTMVQGGYLSFLYLRHLKLRDLKRTCLSVLNYFRSVERTLTINDGGLSLESKQKNANKQNHRVSVHDGSLGGGGGLGNHSYLHYTPADFKISESEFMEFSEVENHDDFYSVDEGRVHVQDQRGYYVIYDAAQEDFKVLEKDLLLIATHFIEKDRNNRMNESKPGLIRQPPATNEVNLASYGHAQVDRFAILLDLWTNEAAYLENKRQLFDTYLESYHHVFDMHEKRSLAQVLTNLMHQRPRFDFTSNYFVRSYRAESRCLRLQCTLVKSILDKQIHDQREYIQRVCRDGDKDFGLPHKIIPKQPIAINLSRPALQHVYLLEFHPSLALASRIPEALKYAFMEACQEHPPHSVMDAIFMEKKLLEIAVKEWEQMDNPGASFSPQIQRDLFSDVYAEDPLFMCEIGQSLMAAQEAKMGRRSTKEKQGDILQIWSRLLETITIRHRLLEVASETEVIAKLYTKHAHEMGFDECHMFLRCVQFEFASFKENADQPPPLFITALQEDDTSIDRYVPSSLFLAIQELDEKHVGQFSFRTRDGFLKLMKGNALDSLQVVLMCQIVHKNALLCSVQQASICSYFKGGDKAQTDKVKERFVETETSIAQTLSSSYTDLQTMHSQKQLATPSSKDPKKPAGKPRIVRRDSSVSAVAFAAKLHQGMQLKKRAPEAFISLQLEKTPARDVMLNDFLTKKAAKGTIMKNQEEVEKLKRALIAEFCRKFTRRMSQYSLRGQIIGYINSMLRLLDDFGNVRKTHFVVGVQNEKKTKMDDKIGLETNPRELKKRPNRQISADTTTLLNLWFLPHHTEVLTMFKTLDEDTCLKGLHATVRLMAALHDILQYLCAHAKLGSSHARLGSQKMEFVTADWGGTEGICAELREIQKQINSLENPTDPHQVADYLTLRRDVLFLEFDTSMRHSLCDTLLSTGNIPGYRTITDSIYTALTMLSSVQRPGLFNAYMNVPEPLQARDADALALYPWRAYLGRRGPYPLRIENWYVIAYNMQLCLAGLKDVDRHVANGEILGVSLLMEDILQSGYQDLSMVGDDIDSEDGDGKAPTPKMSRRQSVVSAKSGASRPTSAVAEDGESSTEVTMKKGPLSRTAEPMASYMLLKDFLIIWKQLEMLKTDWATRKLGVEEINTRSLYKKFCKIYKMDIMYPVVMSIARRNNQAEQYEGMVADDEPIVAPQGTAEIELRAKQLVKLLESLEIHMIHELERKVAREHSLVLAERAREEGTLPTDLWKKPVINERITMAKPQIVEDFAATIVEAGRFKEESVTISKEDLNSALSQLANAIMRREKSNFESYSMFYENLLRQHHQMLYQKEQEIKQLKRAYHEASSAALVDVQCQLADRSHELILEVTGLRAKLAEMTRKFTTQEHDITERVKDEYDALVQNLFSSAFDLKVKYDEFGTRLYNEVFNMVSEVRRDADDAMSQFQSKNPGGESGYGPRLNLKRAEELSILRQENNEMTRLLLKMRCMGSWKTTQMREHYNKLVSELQHDVDKCKRAYLEIKMMADEEVILLRQQLVALRKAMASSEKERETIQKQLDKEMKIKLERKHKQDQEARSLRQLEAARTANLEKLVDDIEDKEIKLRILTDEYDRASKMFNNTQDKTTREVTQMRSQLGHERNLKLDAFQRVDELQTQVYDIEQALSSMSRPYTAATMISTRSRSTSPEKLPKSRAISVASGLWPPPSGMPPNFQQRSLTPDPWPHQPNNERDRITQRPKSVGTRLRNRIAEQLLTDLEPDHHETIMQLQKSTSATKL
ncbi:uncharacterized protein [Amphiura filiformis]|uniref:uncharacterized protein isoform X2 n=1 Tax=Amphiura filiformis TaxID=82378 RepID=UPI003B21F174